MFSFGFFSNSRVVVTGHTGFKGSWLCIWLNYLGAHVYGISDSIPTVPSNFVASNVSTYVTDLRIDIRDYASLNKAIHEINPDFVFHLAAQPLVRKSFSDPLSTWSINTLGTVNLLESLRHLDHKCAVIVVTSDKAYDNVEWVWGYKETDKLGGPDPYSASKGAADIAAQSFIRTYFINNHPVRVAIARAGNVIGGGDWADDRIVPDCIRSWSSNEVVELRNPSSTRPWQHVLEPLSGYLVLALKLYDTHDFHGEAFNFGPQSALNASVGELVSLMASHWGNAQYLDLSTGNDLLHESVLLKLNCDKALHYLDWTSVWDFATTVKATIDWYTLYYNTPLCNTHQFTLSQIECYSINASAINLPWAL